MRMLISYDVATRSREGRRRLRRVAQACEDHGQRVQFSVFECILGDSEWVQLRARLLGILSEEEDSLRVYFIDEAAAKKTEHHGVRAPVDFEGPLIV
ncbi:MAG: CRISPR-associated endonuclease Cas2 [Deltaproteobacteria bacterium]|nr:CRISPR-associated endonuclease Cas2 [Deltaproteobacteria bacterium]